MLSSNVWWRFSQRKTQNVFFYPSSLSSKFKFRISSYTCGGNVMQVIIMTLLFCLGRSVECGDLNPPVVGSKKYIFSCFIQIFGMHKNEGLRTCMSPCQYVLWLSHYNNISVTKEKAGSYCVFIVFSLSLKHLVKSFKWWSPEGWVSFFNQLLFTVRLSVMLEAVLRTKIKANIKKKNIKAYPCMFMVIKKLPRRDKLQRPQWHFLLEVVIFLLCVFDVSFHFSPLSPSSLL